MRKITPEQAIAEPQGFINDVTVTGVYKHGGKDEKASWGTIGGVKLKAWSTDMGKFNGNAIELSGMAIKNDPYQGKDKLTINEKTKLTVVGDVPAQPGQPAQPAAAQASEDYFVAPGMWHAMKPAFEWMKSDPENDGNWSPTLLSNYAVMVFDAHKLAVATKEADL